MSVVIRVIGLSLLALGMFIYPQEVLNSAGASLTLWWRFVLPALLPFFILSELLMASGFVHFLGVFLESLMRPIFRLPGQAAFVVAMGYTSGFPMGAVLTARLRKAGKISRIEGERLLAFTNNPSPGFMFGAVASGMLGKPSLGVVLAASVYLANLMVGFLFRFYHFSASPAQSLRLPSFQQAWHELKTAQLQDKRTLGQLLSDSIKQSFTTVLMVGGFMAFFSVILRLLNIWRITFLLASLSHYLVRAIPLSIQQAFFNGLLEMTIGCQQSIQAVPIINQQIALLALLMGWSGLSVFAQIIGFISGTDLRIAPFIAARTLHGIFALGLSQLFLKFAKLPVMALPSQSLSPQSQFWSTWHLSLLMFLGASGILLSLAASQRLHR
ncbi:sporulation integral membrane protein YlbJ [Desulfosporosinus acidiphilus SJ4]|uniref:Sporulation integral membrane protein YlbJ n=1 Tax=Desulfosporosinus acidiphilus (strain DSM 22704 / JCM 16185 / SJ4) TaxID=646529 RepID=I4D9S1_DESAJ|nr:sporulation integral membrane protein YlbJ [Desulfosporosinus acidiphilus]AFM42545.1 sporulation integral membrane protein YlbJ [Desulfosporosinus acidiphilus SJ4]